MKIENDHEGVAGIAVHPRSANGRVRSGWLLATAALLLTAASAHAQFGSEPVGVASGARYVTVTTTATGSVSRIEVLTMGAAGLDFGEGQGVSTCEAISSGAAGQTCIEPVTFTPQAPGLRIGAVELLDTAGRVLGTANLSGIGSGGLGILVPGNELTVAGGGSSSDLFEDGDLATNALLSLPTGVAMDGAGNLYIADSAHNRIRMVCVSRTAAIIKGTACTGAGIISTIAGNGRLQVSGDDGPDSFATLNDPTSVAIDGAGNLYIADTGNNVIRMIASSTGMMSTIAGGVSGGFSGDGGPAHAAQLRLPRGVSIDADGNIYIADTGNHRIRRISKSDWAISTVVGNGSADSNGEAGFEGDGGSATKAELNFPGAVAFDVAGNMYIPDTANNRVRVVRAVDGAISAASTITTFAGDGMPAYSGDGGAADQAGLRGPSSVAIDAAGNVWIADTGNDAIRKVNAATLQITTVIGAGIGKSYVGGEVNAATLDSPTGILIDARGNIFVADTRNMRVRKIEGNLAPLEFSKPLRQLEKSAPILQKIENVGNEPLDFVSIRSWEHAGINEDETTCTTGRSQLEVARDCAIGVVFAPTVAGKFTGNIKIRTVRETPLLIQLVGNATAANSTTTSVASNLNPSGFGQDVTFTAVVQTGAGTGKLSGTVTFFDGAAALASGVTPGAQGTTVTAIYTTAFLGVGKHSISATYSGDAGHTSSTSTAASGSGLPQPPLIQDVLEGTSTKIVSSANPSALGERVTFTATAAALPVGGVTPDGSITYMDGPTILANVALNGSATATYTTTALVAGTHLITSTYGGDAAKDIFGSTSLTLNQQVLALTTNLLTSSQNPSIYGSAVKFTSTIASNGGATPIGLVNFLDDAVKIGSGTLAGSPAAVTITTSALSAATHTITAKYAGDAANNASSSAPVTQTVTIAAAAPTFTVALPPSLTLKTTENATLTVTLASSAGFADTIALGCASLPIGVNCHFSPVSVALPANGTATNQLTIDTNSPLTGGASAMNAHGGNRSSSLAGALATFSLMFGAILWHFRKRHKGVWNLLLALPLSAATLLVAGCSGRIVFGAAPGVYVIQVTGSGIKTNTIHYQNVTLTIMK